jgi:hypothetical protein
MTPTIGGWGPVSAMLSSIICWMGEELGGWGYTPSGTGLTPNPEVCSAERGTFLDRRTLTALVGSMCVPGGWMESRADQYRRLAEECLALFRLGGFSMQGRLNLLEMARIWNRLADEGERYAALRPSQLLEADKAVAQQQVQPEKDGNRSPPQ